MRDLADHYAATRVRFPDDDLMIVFDIDGTILDMRHMVRHLLLEYDRRHGTRYFYGLRVEDVGTHENHVDELLDLLSLPDWVKADVLRWYLDNRWASWAILASHRPFRGVLDIIRWFQLQERTYVGLNTGRPDAIRGDTLASLNELGREYRVRFDDALLFMNPNDWEEGVRNVKAQGLRHFRELGYRVFAAVDNEPSNLASMAEVDRSGDVLFLHAETLFESGRRDIPRSVGGSEYELSGLVRQEDLPRHVQLVWHGVNDRANLDEFLGSPIRWGECDVRPDPLGRLVLREESFEALPWSRGEEIVSLEEVLEEFRTAGKSIKLDLKEGGETLERVLATVADFGFEPGRLWFNGNIDELGQDGFGTIARALPEAVIQCPIDFLCPMLTTMPARALEILETLRGWGIQRFSLSWGAPCLRRVFDRLRAWGLEVNLYDVPDLEGFLQAALLLPRSLTADFNFPQWRYFGHGPTRKGEAVA